MAAPTTTRELAGETLYAVLSNRAEVTFALLGADVLDGHSAEDVVQEVITEYQDGTLEYDDSRGAPAAFLKTVITNRIYDHARRDRRKLSLNQVPVKRISGLAPEHAKTGRRSQIIDAIKRRAEKDKEVEKLLAAIEARDEIPANMDQALACDMGWTESEAFRVRNIKQRIKWTLRRLLKGR